MNKPLPQVGRDCSAPRTYHGRKIFSKKNTVITSLEEIARIKSPEILVAGCGTGQHS